MYCPSCGLQQPDDHRFCVACGYVLPSELIRPKRPKVTMLFPGIPTHSADPPEPVMRASRYVEDIEIETADGSVTIPGHHVRFSIWVVDRPVCAMSLPDSEAERLARFLLAPLAARSENRSTVAS
jgi:hypothetical protein